jgi:hypothetical protein
MILRLAFALSFGVMAGGFIGAGVTGDWIYTIVAVIALAVAVLTGITLVILRTRSRSLGTSGSRSSWPRSARWIAIAVLGVIGLGSVAVPVIVTTASGRLDDPITGTHQSLAMQGIASAAGTKKVTELDLYPGYVLADVVRSPGSSTIDEWVWQYGRASNTGPEVVPPENIAQASFDMTSIDMTQVLADVAKAKKLGKMPASAELHVGVRREPDDNNELQVTVFQSTSGATATVVFDDLGQVLDRFGNAAN